METTSTPSLFAADAAVIPSSARDLQQPVILRTITWPTNFNNKMACAAMVHIDLQPFKKPIRAEVENSVIEIYTADHSHPPIRARLFDMLYVKLKRVTCLMTLPSHGLDELDFVTYMLDRYPEKLTLDTEVVVYYYKKLL